MAHKLLEYFAIKNGGFRLIENEESYLLYGSNDPDASDADFYVPVEIVSLPEATEFIVTTCSVKDATDPTLESVSMIETTNNQPVCITQNYEGGKFEYYLPTFTKLN